MSKKIEDVIVGEMPRTGPVTIDVEKTAALWNHLWWICEWRNTENGNFRLIRYNRKDSPSCAKITISEEQAQELIEKVNLTEIDEPMMRSAFSWKRQSDIDALEKWITEKNNKKYGIF